MDRAITGSENGDWLARRVNRISAAAFCSIRTIDSSKSARIRSRSTPPRARAIWASTTPNLTPRLNREPRVSSAR